MIMKQEPQFFMIMKQEPRGTLRSSGKCMFVARKIGTKLCPNNPRVMWCQIFSYAAAVPWNDLCNGS